MLQEIFKIVLVAFVFTAAVVVVTLPCSYSNGHNIHQANNKEYADQYENWCHIIYRNLLQCSEAYDIFYRAFFGIAMLYALGVFFKNIKESGVVRDLEYFVKTRIRIENEGNSSRF